MKKNSGFIFSVTLIFIVFTAVPYLWGILLTPGDGKFIGFTRNIDDMAVYMSWIKQVMDGNFITYNLFQENIKSGMQINIYFVILGWIAKLISFSPTAILHLFMVLQNAVLVYVFWLFTKLFFKEDTPRKIALVCFLFAGGIGGFVHELNSIDLWQTEAITFMSAYLNPLFTISLIIMIGISYNLLRYFQSFSMKYLIFASLLFLILGNVHTYDCVIIAFVWISYTLFTVIYRKDEIKSVCKFLLLNALFLILGSVSILFNFFIYMKDEIYRSRVESMIFTPSIGSVLSGFGLLVLFSILGIFFYRGKKININHFTFLLIWLILGLLVIYIPFSQQRKFIMGYEIPLSLMTGSAIFYISSLIHKRFFKNIFLCTIIILMSFTNFYNIKNDVDKLAEMKTATHYFAYMSDDELEVLNFIKENKKNFSTVWASPQISLFIPSYTGVNVYYGHWSETPNYANKLKDYLNFVSGNGYKIFGDSFVIPVEVAEKFEENYPKQKILFQNRSFVIFQ